MRVGLPLRGTSASLRRASKRSSMVFDSSLAMPRSRSRLPLYCLTRRLRRLFFSTELFFAMGASLRCPRLRSSISLPEREVEMGQQRLRLGVGLGRRRDDDVHAPHSLGLVVVDLREHEVLLDPEGVVAAP